MGESQPGSWPIQTPFATSAITVQPTEQCVQTFADGDLRAGRRDARFCLAHARERQRAERGETAGGEAGAAQESAAIETTIGVALQCAGERAATSLTVCSLDQHRPLPQLGYRLTR